MRPVFTPSRIYGRTLPEGLDPHVEAAAFLSTDLHIRRGRLHVSDGPELPDTRLERPPGQTPAERPDRRDGAKERKISRRSPHEPVHLLDAAKFPDRHLVISFVFNSKALL
jgi:hypothetical protein